MVINTNIAAQTAATNLNKSTNMLNESLARLSSGSKIVSPADDPAGAAESISLNAQMNQTSAANANVGNAISFLQTQDGYLQQVGSALDEMAKLSVLSQDVTKTNTERKDYQSEFSTLAGYITHAIEDFPVDPKSIYEMVVAANSTMRDLFFRLSVYSIGQNPYQSITELEMADGRRTTTSLAAAAGRLLLPIHPRARVYGLPVISGHVGADAAACMLAVDLANEDRLVAVMDIGTNTELILGNKHKILAASCPAGPAFEGGKISCGMPGLPGAIEKVVIDPDGSMRVQVIGEGEADGICGSGLIDLLSELLRTERMNALGRFEHGAEPVMVQAGDDQPICLTEGDVNELAQAKGANAAGLHVIYDRYGIRFDEVDVFYLAGGFGRHLNVASAKRIGMIPDIDDAKIVQVGNASIEGACIALLSRAKRAELESMVRGVTHCRLETHPDFFHYFVEGCQFNPVISLAAR